MRFSDAITEFLKYQIIKVNPVSIDGYELHLKQFCMWLRDCRIEEVKLRDILEYLGYFKKLGYTNNTIIRYVVAFRKFFDFFARQGFKVVDPLLIPYPQAEQRLPRVADENDFKKFVKAITEKKIKRKGNYPWYRRDLALVYLLHDTGARIGELTALDFEDIDLKAKLAMVKTEKSRDRNYRKIYWGDKANGYLRKWLAVRSRYTNGHERALFIALNSWNKGKRWDKAAAGEMIRKYLNKAGLQYKFNSHGLGRHSKARRIIKNNGDLVDVMNILGHKTPNYTYLVMFGKDMDRRAREFLRREARRANGK